LGCATPARKGKTKNQPEDQAERDAGQQQQGQAAARGEGQIVAEDEACEHRQVGDLPGRQGRGIPACGSERGIAPLLGLAQDSRRGAPQLCAFYVPCGLVGLRHL